MYTFITLALIVLGLLVLLPKFKQFTVRYGLAVNFFLTLIATLVGVLLAISIANYEEDRKEKQAVIKLLSSSISSVDECLEYTHELVNYYQTLAQGSALKSEFYQKNPPPYPDYIDVLLTQTVVNKNLSSDSLSDLNELLINVKRSRTIDATLYAKFLTQLIKLIEIEIAFQQGTIKKAQLEQKLEELKKDFLR